MGQAMAWARGGQRRDLLDQRGQALAGEVPLVAFPDPPAVGQPAHVVLQAVAQQLRVAPRVEGHGPGHRLVKRGEPARVQDERCEAVDAGLAPGEGPAVDRHQAGEPARMAAGVADPDYSA